MRDHTKILALAALLAAPAMVQADPYDQLSQELAGLAVRTGYKRIAVMPLQPMSGHSHKDGEILAARLVSVLALRSGIEIVERTLLDQVLEEQGLGYKGVIRPEQAKAVGQVLGVDAIITGTYLKLRSSRIEVHTRLIDTETARVIGAAKAEVRREWEEEFEMRLASADVWDTPPPAIKGFETEDFAPRSLMRDALADIDSCENWETRVKTTQESMVEARARFWAARLRDPRFKVAKLTKNPGSDIRDLGLRRKFYSRTEELYAQGFQEPLSVREQERLDASDREVERVLEECYHK